MKKGKLTVCIIMAIVCFAFTTVIFMRFKVVNQTDITSIENMRKEELRSELAKWKSMYKGAEQQYSDKLAKLNEYTQNQKNTEESSKLLDEELNQINMYLGKTNVQGQGIVITIKDIDNKNMENEEIDPISAEDLLVIVDYLKLAGAEAISINEERIINMSDIVYVSNSIVFVNQQRILSPYVIKAIGEQSKLESTLLGNGGYVETLRNYRI